MKNIFKIFGIIAIAAIIGFSFTACGDSGGGGSFKIIVSNLEPSTDYNFGVTDGYFTEGPNKSFKSNESGTVTFSLSSDHNDVWGETLNIRLSEASASHITWISKEKYKVTNTTITLDFDTDFEDE